MITHLVPLKDVTSSSSVVLTAVLLCLASVSGAPLVFVCVGASTLYTTGEIHGEIVSSILWEERMVGRTNEESWSVRIAERLLTVFTSYQG